MPKKNYLLALVSLSALAASCATPPDGPVCVGITPARGYCFHTLEEKEFPVDDEHLYEGKTWRQLDQDNLRIPPSYWAKLKGYMLKQCKKHKDCDKNLGKWERQASKVDQAIGEAAK